MPTEQEARKIKVRLLAAAGRHVTNLTHTHIHAVCGVRIREFPLAGHGSVDLPLRVCLGAVRVINAERRSRIPNERELEACEFHPHLLGSFLPLSIPSANLRRA